MQKSTAADSCIMNQSELYFAESDGKWQSIPEWVNFLIGFGYHWGASENSNRRIAILSMPCSSPAAGLIALGALIRDLGRLDANDMATHNDSLLCYARQYLDYCAKCDLLKCDPTIRGCGFDSKSNGVIRSVRLKNHIYMVSEKTDFGEKRLVLFDKRKPSATIEPNAEYTANFYFNGQPPAVSSSGETGLQESSYQGFIEEAKILPENLRKSYSGLLLAGRAKGARDTRAAYESVFFCNETESRNLAELLAIHDWADSEVSRSAFFNVRTEEPSHAAVRPQLIVADGDASFLKSIDAFNKSDIIGVIDRSQERDKLEAIGQKFAALRTWYQNDSEFQERLPAPVPGISVAILKQQ